VDDWRLYGDLVMASVRSGKLDRQTASAVSIIVANVQSSASARATLEQHSQEEISTLSEHIRSIAISDHDSKHQPRRRLTF